MSSTRRITESDADKRVDLHIGDTLELSLNGNPSTGYQWQIRDRDSTILRQDGEREFTRSGNVGGGGTVTFRFEAIAPGETELRLTYNRPFEKDVPPAEKFDVVIAVS